MVVSPVLGSILRQPPYFSPLWVPGCKLWLEADRIGGLVDQSAVATWADQSGLGNNVTQATGTKQPLWVTRGATRSRPVVRFGGTDDLLVRAGAPPFNQQCGAVFVVCNLVANTSVTLFSASDEAASVDLFQMRLTLGATLRILTTTNSGTAFQGTVAAPAIATATTWVIGIFTDGATWSASINGAPLAVSTTTGTNTGDWFGDWTTMDNIVVGAQKVAVESEQITGDFAAVLVYDRATPLTAAEQRAVAYGLGYKYNAAMA